MLKNSLGQVGAQVEVISCGDYDPGTLLEHMKRKDFDLVEEYVLGGMPRQKKGQGYQVPEQVSIPGRNRHKAK